MDLSLKNKVALVAGSSRGIGKAIAASFLQEGARVVITGRGQEAVEATLLEFQNGFGAEAVRHYVGDMTDLSTIRECLQQTCAQWSRIDCVVANIGSGKSTTGWHVDPSEWSRMIDLNLQGSFQLVNEVMPHLVEKGGGSVVLVSSIAGVEAIQAPLAYSAAKAALLSYGKNLSRLVAPLGVRVNVVAPGNILFPGGSWENQLKNSPESCASYIEREVPMGRFGRPNEIADFVVFLCSPRASFATGLCAVIDGGQTRTI